MNGLRWTPEQFAAYRNRVDLAKGELTEVTAIGAGTSRARQDAAGRAIGGSEGQPYVASPPAPPAAVVVVPYPRGVSGNHASAPGLGGARYLTKEHRAYRAEVARIIAERRIGPILGRLALLVHVAPPDNRARDLDNVWKVVGDALQHAGLYPNDGAIDDLHLIRIKARIDCGVVVTARVIRA